MFESDFFSNRRESIAKYLSWVEMVTGELLLSFPEKPYEGDRPGELRSLLETEIFPHQGLTLDELRDRLGRVAQKCVAVSHPFTAAHLHTPVLLPAVAAEMVISALNQSMVSFDQAPSATIIEENVINWLCALAGLPATAGGTFTAGGTQSNFMALLLARDRFLATRWNWCARERGLPPDAHRLRILCSEAAHFSVEKSAIQLGLGLQSVVKVGCDAAFQLCPAALDEKMRSLRQDGLQPIAIVATAGTTDFGSFDPIAPLASIAAAQGIWLHVDAAYGGAMLVSRRHRHRLEGLEKADSITIDFHKAFFQPISCGAFLLSDARRFELIRVHADYLNGADRERDGIPDLVTRSVLTSRRFDALKLWLSLQSIGKERFEAMVERLVELAHLAAWKIAERGNFELLHRPQFGSVVFRYVPQDSPVDSNGVNGSISKHLFDSGTAVVGHTVIEGKTCLKLTFSNPCTTDRHLDQLLELIANCGRDLSARQPALAGA